MNESVLTNLGSIAAIIAGLGIIIGFGAALWQRHLIRNPFSVKGHWLWTRSHEGDIHDDDDIRSGRVLNRTECYTKSESKMYFQPGTYNTIIKLSSNLPLTINGVNLRFLGAEQYRPQILRFAEVDGYEPRTFDVERDQSFGMIGWYPRLKHINKGKLFYFFATFCADGYWEGELSLRFFVVGSDARSVRINALCKDKQD